MSRKQLTQQKPEMGWFGPKKTQPGASVVPIGGHRPAGRGGRSVRGGMQSPAARGGVAVNADVRQRVIDHALATGDADLLAAFSGDHTGTHLDIKDQGNRAARRAAARKHTRTAREIARRNRRQMAPHAVTAAMLGLGELLHAIAQHTQMQGVIAAAAAMGAAAAGGITLWQLNRLRKIPEGWDWWSKLLVLATSAWLVVAVLVGVDAVTFAAALAGDFSFGARWWARHRHDIGEPDMIDKRPEQADIALYAQRWLHTIGAKDGVLAGSYLVDGNLFAHGIEYTLRLKPGKQDLEQVQAATKKIASGLEVTSANLMIEPHEAENDSLVKFQIITASPVRKPVLFTGPRLKDGRILLGPYADGRGYASYRLYTEDSMWGGIVVGGTGSGKSRLLELIGLVAMFTSNTYVIHVDGQSGRSCPALWNAVPERYGRDDAETVLARLEAMQAYREKNPHDPSDTGFTPSEDYPGVLVILDEAHRLITNDNWVRWSQIARECRKIGIAILAGDQDATLKTWRDAVMRDSLQAGNGIGLRTNNRAGGQILDEGDGFNLRDLPKGKPGFGYVMGSSESDDEDTRQAPYRGEFLPSARNAKKLAEKGTPLPEGTVLIEDWFEQANQVAAALDAGSDTAIPMQAPEVRDGRGTVPGAGGVRQSSGPAMPTTQVRMPTVGTPPAPELSGSQREVLAAVRDGFDTPAVISGQVGISTRQVGKLLGQLAEIDLVDKAGAGPSVSYTATDRAEALINA